MAGVCSGATSSALKKQRPATTRLVVEERIDQQKETQQGPKASQLKCIPVVEWVIDIYIYIYIYKHVHTRTLLLIAYPKSYLGYVYITMYVYLYFRGQQL